MATMQRTTVVGIFQNREAAQRAVEELRRNGFREDQIGIMARESDDTDATIKSTEGTGTRAEEGAAAGLLTGAGIGAAWGLGIMAGLLPAIGPVIAGGTLAAILASAGLGAAAAGLAGFLIGMGVSEDEATYYETEFKSGRTLVTVKADTRYDEAATILRRHGGHVQERSGKFTQANWAGATSATSGVHAGTRTTDANQKVQLREEELHVRKQPVQTGEVRVRKEVTTEHKTLEVPVTKEEVVIERHAVSGRQPATGDIREGEELRIPITEEQVHVEKTPVVKEEVTVGKRKVQDTEHVSGTVRKEHVKIEREGDADVRDDSDNKRKR